MSVDTAFDALERMEGKIVASASSTPRGSISADAELAKALAKFAREADTRDGLNARLDAADGANDHEGVLNAERAVDNHSDQHFAAYCHLLGTRPRNLDGLAAKVRAIIRYSNNDPVLWDDQEAGALIADVQHLAGEAVS